MVEDIRTREDLSAELPSLWSIPAADIVLHEWPSGQLSLTTADYQLIADRLPTCLQQAEDDGSPGEPFVRFPLRQEIGDRTYLLTRNVLGIAQLLEEAGKIVEIDRRFGIPLCRNPVATGDVLLALTKIGQDDVRDDLFEITESLHRHRYGQFVARDERHKLSLAAAICKAFPKAPMVFVVESKKKVAEVAAELEVRLNERVWRAYGLKAIAGRRITIATYWATRTVGLRDAPFLILPSWRPGFPLWMRQLIWYPSIDRLYLLRSADERMSAVDQDRVLGRLGPVLAPSAVAPYACHTFSLYRFGGKAAGAQESRSAEHHQHAVLNKCKLYWHHRRRNQAVAALARLLNTDTKPVAVLVETLEHAQELASLLPGWPILSNGVATMTPPGPCIVTLTAAAASKEFRPATVLWAAGGPPSTWLDEWLRKMSAAGRSVQLIDLEDAFSPDAMRLARARQRSYRSLGCHWRPLPNSVVRRVGQALKESSRQERPSAQMSVCGG